jgi:hypothetical protein
MKPLPLRFASALLFLTASTALHAWDYEGHRMVNQLALAALPADFPSFVHEPAAAARIAFLAGEPDRWRNVPDLPLRQTGTADHYLDLEQLPEAGLDPTTVSSFRDDFVVAFAAARAAHPANFPGIDPEKDADHTREWPGFAPWAITEYYEKLKSTFSYLKIFEELGSPEEIANAQANVIYVMGVMGHYVGDCAQPLHTTVHHNGWVGPNPHGYTTWSKVHSWIDGGFINKAGIVTSDIVGRVTPASALALPNRDDGRDPMFVAVMNYIIAQNQLVEPLYQMEKAGKFSDEAEKAGHPVHGHAEVNPEGRAFIEGQLLKGGEMLAAIWETAWRSAGPDTYLRAQLLKRHAAAQPSPSKTAP